jgi:hypothetical protein
MATQNKTNRRNNKTKKNGSVKAFNIQPRGTKKSDWGTLVRIINVENGIKLGFLLQ